MNEKEDRRGILGGGTWIIDRVKRIDVFPHPETLSNIKSESRGTGGAPYNVLLNLSKLGADLPLSAAGLVGNDELGKEIVRDCHDHKIDTRQLKSSKDVATSYTDVMTEIESGRRTFFHFQGANAIWTGSDLCFDRSRARLFHLGYLLLLDALDATNKEYGTEAAALLARARAAGLKTSIDVVSEDSNRFSKIILPALKHTDYCIINEVEAGRTTGFKVRDKKGTLDLIAIKHAAGKLLQSGIHRLVVIHFLEGAFARTKEGIEHWQSSLKVPKKEIKGTAGAGDAFCAGVLWGLHEEWELSRSLFIGVCVAAASLSDPTCTGGVRPLEDCLALSKKYRTRSRLDAKL